MLKVKEDMKKGEYKGAYLLWGEEDFLKDYYKKALTQKLLNPDLADFNYKEYVSEKPDTEEVELFLSSYPCMSDKKVLFIKNSEIFKKCSESEKKVWQEIFENIPDFAVIIFSEKNVDKRSALYKFADKNFSVDEFPFQKEADLINWIVRYTKNAGKDISVKNAKYLTECCGLSMYTLKNEIEKLCSHKMNEKEILQDDIDECVCKMAESRVFDMLDAFLSKNSAKGAKLYADLKLLKEEPIVINGAIFAKFNQMKKVMLLSSLPASEIASKLGQRDFIVKMWQRDAAKTNLEHVNKILALCSETDHRIKNGLSAPWAAMDILIANLMQN